MNNNNDIWQCILYEKLYIIPSDTCDYIKKCNKDKDVYFNNPETKEVSFYNYCIDCYDSEDGILSYHTMTNY